jgi:hypothetical protein
MNNKLFDALTGIARVRICFWPINYSDLIKSELNVAIARGAPQLDPEHPDLKVVDQAMESRFLWIHIGMVVYFVTTIALILSTGAIAILNSGALLLSVVTALLVIALLLPGLLEYFLLAKHFN